jgi:hypothetical protein
MESLNILKFQVQVDGGCSKISSPALEESDEQVGSRFVSLPLLSGPFARRL